MVYVAAADVLSFVEKSSPTAFDTTWSGMCADAVDGFLIDYLADLGVTPSASQANQLEAAALTDAAALFNSRKAPHGVASIGPDGDVVRLGADSIRACWPVLHRIARPGIG